MGLALFAFIPIGAFVEPDEESRLKASRGSQTRMFAAGVTNNFFVAFVGFLLLFGPVAGSISAAQGVPIGNVAEGGTAADAGLEYGDVITEVEGQPVANVSEMSAELDRVRERQVDVTLRGGETATLERRLLLSRSVASVAGGLSPSPENTIGVETVNGSAVYTERQFAAAMDDRLFATIGTDEGTATFPVGAYGLAAEGGALTSEGAPTNTDVIVTRLDGERTPNETVYSQVLGGLEAGSTVETVAYVDGERTTYDVTVGGGDGGDALGLRTQPGYSGVTVVELGVNIYPAETFLAYLGGNNGLLGGLLSGEFVVLVFQSIYLPFFSALPTGSAFGFAGFLSPVTNFYAVSGPLSAIGAGGVFTAANVLFWSAWVNLNLGLFNCVPTFPLDGGHILRASAESFVARLPVDDGRRLTSAVTASVSLVMITGLFLMIFGPGLLN